MLATGLCDKDLDAATERQRARAPQHLRWNDGDTIADGDGDAVVRDDRPTTEPGCRRAIAECASEPDAREHGQQEGGERKADIGDGTVEIPLDRRHGTATDRDGDDHGDREDDAGRDASPRPLGQERHIFGEGGVGGKARTPRGWQPAWCDRDNGGHGDIMARVRLGSPLCHLLRTSPQPTARAMRPRLWQKQQSEASLIKRTHILAVLAIGVVGLTAAACGGSGDESEGSAGGNAGSIRIDGSSTVAPLATLAAERFEQQGSGTRVTVGTSGTGGGFEKFCNGETEIATASRAIKDEEQAMCDDKGVAFTEVLVANDGIAIVANVGNDWAPCLTTDQLAAVWGPESTATRWSEIDASFPDDELKLFGPGTDSGTFDFFTKEINGEEGASRTDYSPSEDDNVTIQGVEGETGGLGYFGLSYYEQNKDQLALVEVDSGDGCVAPTTETVQDGSYTPLSRPLYLYVATPAEPRPELKAFMTYMIDNEKQIATDALFVPLSPEQLADAQAKVAALAG